MRVRLFSPAGELRHFSDQRLLILSRREGLTPNCETLFRLWREKRLSVRRRGGRKRTLGKRAPAAVPRKPVLRQSLGFVSDTCHDEGRFCILVDRKQRAREGREVVELRTSVSCHRGGRAPFV